MPRPRTLLLPVLAAALAGAGAAAAAPSERLVSGWNPMSLTFSGNGLAYARSTAAVIPQGGYTVFRTDTFRIPLSGAALAPRQVEGVVMRTSAGRTTAGPMAGDGTGRYLITATGSGFPAQLILCCPPDPQRKPLPLPVEASGRIDGPVTVAATLDGPLVRYVLSDPAGASSLVTFHLPGSPLGSAGRKSVAPLDAEIAGPLVGIAPGLLAWVDRAVPPSLHLAGLPADRLAPTPGPVIAQGDTVLRLHVSAHAVATLVRTPAGGVALVRYDPPSWTPIIVWTGDHVPALTALGDRTVALVDGGVLQQQVSGAPRRNLYRVRGTPAALATDGTRIAVIERRTVRVRKRLVRKSAIVVVAVRRPPGAYVQKVTP